ncbi:pseudaminic acid biosynthesis-associated protein PseG [Thiovulum sp. ES]|nr:pseudaminic acid biosynthesis-associated protein PseG [Thiovulum sp. ES]
MRTLFRADSSSKIGLGHIMRDLVLAQQYENSDIYFATQNLNGNINHKILESKYKLIDLKTNSVEELIKNIKDVNIDEVVFDHYEIDYIFEKKVKDETGVKILSFDDTYQKHYCDILLNHNISANENRYKNLVPENCELRCGAKYTLIRDEFKNISLKTPKQPTIFLAMGGADTSNLSLEILKIIPEGFKVNLVTTSSNPNISELKKFVEKDSFIELHINTVKIAQIMANSTLAIISPSVILHEVLYLRLPFIAIQTANNQKDISEYLKQNRYIILEKFDREDLKEILWKILN